MVVLRGFTIFLFYKYIILFLLLLLGGTRPQKIGSDGWATPK